MEIVKLRRNKQAQYQESLAILMVHRCTSFRCGKSLITYPVSNDFFYSRLFAGLFYKLFYV